LNGALLTLTSLVVAGLFGFLWYLLSRQASRIDGLDDRLRGVQVSIAHLEERFTRLEERFEGVESSIAKVLDKLQDLDSRLAHLEGSAA
jgi:uncharacterized coiled-coil protein SlyX